VNDAKVEEYKVDVLEDNMHVNNVDEEDRNDYKEKEIGEIDHINIEVIQIQEHQPDNKEIQTNIESQGDTETPKTTQLIESTDPEDSQIEKIIK
jgi:hypothetical protein